MSTRSTFYRARRFLLRQEVGRIQTNLIQAMGPGDHKTRAGASDESTRIVSLGLTSHAETYSLTTAPILIALRRELGLDKDPLQVVKFEEGEHVDLSR